MIKFINYFFQALIVYLFFLIGKLIGLNFSRKLFSFVFLKIGPFFKSKKIIFQNLENYKSNLSPSEKEKIVSNMWKNYGYTFIEYVFLNYFRKNSGHVKVEGETIVKNISTKAKPVIFISGHFSNFELMSMQITKTDISLAAIYRPLNNYFLNPFMEYLRKKYVCKNQIKKGINGVREAIDFINKGVSIALMIDQRVSEGEKINFFGKPALTTTLPAQLAIKYNLKIVPVFIERDKKNDFRIKFLEEIDPLKFNDKFDLSKKLNNILEMMIKSNPNEWIWSHNRWK